MSKKLRSRKVSRRRNTLRRKGSLKKKSKMMEGGSDGAPKEQTGIDVIFHFIGDRLVEGERTLKIRADFGGEVLEKTVYTAHLGGNSEIKKLAFSNKNWRQLKGYKPLVGNVSQKHLEKHGDRLNFGLVSYARNDFNSYGTGGGFTQIIHKIYNLKDRLCEYYGVGTQ